MKCVLLWCNSVSDVAQPRHILSACQRRCCVNYFGDVVWIWRIIALKCATSASGPLHYMKSNRWLSTTCAICWADLSDFRCNNCQRNEGARRKAISSDSDNITHLEARKTKGIGMRENIKHYTTMERRWRRNKAFTLYRFQLSGGCDTAQALTRFLLRYFFRRDVWGNVARLITYWGCGSRKSSQRGDTSILYVNNILKDLHMWIQ